MKADRPSTYILHPGLSGLWAPGILLGLAMLIASRANTPDKVETLKLLPVWEVDTLVVAEGFVAIARPGQSLTSGDTIGWGMAPDRFSALLALQAASASGHTLPDSLVRVLPDDLKIMLRADPVGGASSRDIRALQRRLARKDAETQRLRSAYLQAAPEARDSLHRALTGAERAQSRAQRDYDRQLAHEAGTPAHPPAGQLAAFRDAVDSRLAAALILAGEAVVYEGVRPQAEAYLVALRRPVSGVWIPSDWPESRSLDDLHGRTLYKPDGTAWALVAKVDAEQGLVYPSPVLAPEAEGVLVSFGIASGGRLLSRLWQWRAR